MRKKDDLDRYYENFLEAIKKVDEEESFAPYFYNISRAGNNRFYQKNITETKHFDEEWITTVESYFPSLDKISKNPKSTIRYDEEVVAIEKAKKTNSASVRHLASHTQLIREVKGDEVIPKKILTAFAEEEIATYENRFLKTLVARLYIFVRNRHEVIKDNVESFQKDHMVYTTAFDINETNVTINMDVLIKKDLDNTKINEHNYQLLRRAERLLTLVQGLKGSQFMQSLAKAKEVRPPIMKTNVILKNADFRNAYTLWLFLDRYNTLTFDVNIKERPVRLSKAFGMNLNRIGITLYSSMLNNMKRRKEDFENTDKLVEYKRKSTKIARNHPSDFVKNPDAIVFENNIVQEYYLEQYRKILGKRTKELLEQTSRDEVALKKAIQETNEISNTLYATAYELDTDNVDYFNRLVKKSNPKEDLAKARKKARIAKIIREIKESDYKKAIKQEKRLMYDINSASNQMIRETNKKKKQEQIDRLQLVYDKEIKVNQKNRQKAKEKIVLLQTKIVDIEGNRTMIQVEMDRINQKAKEEAKVIIAEEKARAQNELAKMKAKHIEDIKQLQEEGVLKLEEVKKRYAERVALEKQTALEKKKQAIEKEREETKKALANEKIKIQTELEETKAKYAAQLKKLQDDNQVKLENLKARYIETLDKDKQAALEKKKELLEKEQAEAKRLLDAEKARVQKELDETKVKYAEQLKKLQDDNQVKIADLKAYYAEAMVKEKDILIEKKKELLEKEQAESKKLLDAEKARAQKELEEAKAKHAEVLKQIQIEGQLKLEEAKKRNAEIIAKEKKIEADKKKAAIEKEKAKNKVLLEKEKAKLKQRELNEKLKNKEKVENVNKASKTPKKENTVSNNTDLSEDVNKL